MKPTNKPQQSKILKHKIRQVIVARNTVERMGESGYYDRNKFATQYLNEMAGEVLKLAKSVHWKLPYYLITRTI